MMMRGLLSCVVCLLLIGTTEGLCDSLPTVIQSFPVGMDVEWADTEQTYSAWIRMIEGAKHEVAIAAFYITLSQGVREFPPSAGGNKGMMVLQALLDAAARGVTIRAVVNSPLLDAAGQYDLDVLEKAGAQIQHLAWGKISGGGGVLHSKFIVVDYNASATVGSANIDWRSLSQTKELGLVVEDCPALSADVYKVFKMYWLMAETNAIPKSFPKDMWPTYSAHNPLKMTLSTGGTASAYMGISPGPFLDPPNSSTESYAILQAIDEANDFLHLSVMEYSPRSLFLPVPVYWPEIDNSIRAAALRNVSVSILCSDWAHTDQNIIPYLQSLDVLPNIHVRVIVIPPFTPTIPFSRVNHVKYVLSDAAPHHYVVSSSNFSPDYFTKTLGVSLAFETDVEWNKMSEIFLKDWELVKYTKKLKDVFPY